MLHFWLKATYFVASSKVKSSKSRKTGARVCCLKIAKDRSAKKAATKEKFKEQKPIQQGQAEIFFLSSSWLVGISLTKTGKSVSFRFVLFIYRKDLYS